MSRFYLVNLTQTKENDMLRKSFIAALVGVTGSVGAAVATTEIPTQTPPSALAFDQKLSGNSIGMSYVYLPEDGYAAIYRSDKNGRPTGAAIGVSALTAGAHRDVKVELKETPKAGERLWVSLYKDSDKKPGFDTGKGDQAFWTKDNKPWEGQLEIK